MPALRTPRVRTRLSNPQEPPPGMTPVSFGEGLQVVSSEVSVDFGTDHDQVPRGDEAGGGSVVANDITDAGTFGKELLRQPTDTDARSELGLGAAALLNVGTSAGTLAAGDDARIVGAVQDTRTVAGHALSSDVTLVKGDVGLGNVDNTSDANKPVSTAQAAADAAVAAAAQAYADAHYAPLVRASLNVMGNAILGTTVGAAPHWCDGASLVLMIWPLSVPGSTKLLLDRGTNDCMIRVGDNGGDRGRLSTYENGTLALLPSDHTITGNLNGCHVLALACTGGNVRSSFDGGAVGVTSVGGAPTPPGGSTIFAVGGSVNGSGTYVPDVEFVAIRTYSTVLSDADLIAAGALAGRNAGAIPALTGTVSWEFAARDLRGVLIPEILHAAVNLDYGSGALKRVRNR